MATAPTVVRQAALAIKVIDTELDEYTYTLHGFKFLLLAQNRVAHVLAVKKLVTEISTDHDNFPEEVRAFAHNIHKEKNDLLFSIKTGVLL